MFIKTSDSRRKQTKFIFIALIISAAIHFVLANLVPNSSGLPGSQTSSRLNVALSFHPIPANIATQTLKKAISADDKVSKPKVKPENNLPRLAESKSEVSTNEILSSRRIHNLASHTTHEKAQPERHTSTPLQTDPDSIPQNLVTNTDIKAQQNEPKLEANESYENNDEVLEVAEVEMVAAQLQETELEEHPIKDNISGSKLSAKPELVRYQIGSNENPKPDYPSLAVRRGWQGEVVLGVHVRADGSIEHLTFVKSTNYGVLNYEAYETVRTSWHFKPLEDEEHLGEPAYIEVPIRFTLANR